MRVTVFAKAAESSEKAAPPTAEAGRTHGCAFRAVTSTD